MYRAGLEVAFLMELDIQTLDFVAGPVVALLVGLVSKSSASSGLKAVINLLFSAIAASLSVVILNDGNLVTQEFLTSVIMVWVTSIASYHGFWKPTNVAPALANATAGFGIGSPPEMEMDVEPEPEPEPEAAPKKASRTTKATKSNG